MATVTNRVMVTLKIIFMAKFTVSITLKHTVVVPIMVTVTVETMQLQTRGKSM